ncbi:hypothetical protein PG999_012949 [Apiospora kogelbergensis]|uniref:2EXR domain-containing protein n=1 Tax=Apiospora kogelbergensis TaxID=1337665 RepID=A0AAW0Q9Y4_9PEZI
MKHHWISGDTPEYLLDKPNDTIPDSVLEDKPPTTQPVFHLFPQLPLEVRLKIWRFSLEPRVLELHSRRTHYAQAEDWPWQSNCYNPALLSVCDEARGEALAALTVALPMPQGGMLYCDPMRDVLAILGDSDLPRLRQLFAEVEDQDPRGVETPGPQRRLLEGSDHRYMQYLVLVDRFKQFRGQGDSWMVVGKAQIRIEELVFMDEDGTRLE